MSLETETTTGYRPDIGIKKSKIAWGRVCAIALVFLILAGVCVRYYRQTYEWLCDRNAMDIAQVARNITDGQGFVTRFIRPFNATIVPATVGKASPELNHPPLYPYLVAAAMKAKSPADQTVVLTSLAFLYLTVCATFLLGCVLFDWRAGLIGMAATGLSQPVLRAGMSGQEWPCGALLFTLLLTTVALHHKYTTTGKPGMATMWTLASGLLTGALCLTSRTMLVLLVPLVIYFLTTGRNRPQDAGPHEGRIGRRLIPAVLTQSRTATVILFLVMTLVLVGPLAYRDMHYTGMPFMGINAFDVMANTSVFPGDSLYRQTDTANQNVWKAVFFPFENIGPFGRKLFTGVSEQASALLGALGLAVAGFVVVSTLYRFKKPTANALRGLAYGLLPTLIVLFAIYGIDNSAVIIFVPIAAVFGSAYFLLLLEAKKLHLFFVRALVTAFLVVTAFPAIGPLMWRPQSEEEAMLNETANRYFGDIGTGSFHPGTMYTDVPWIAAWRTTGLGVWLPRADSDVFALEAKDLDMKVVILTQQSGKYQSSEIWYQLHKVRTWRDYMNDPDKTVAQILATVGIDPQNKPLVDKYLQRLHREYAVANALKGFKPTKQDPLAEDDLQVLVYNEGD